MEQKETFQPLTEAFYYILLSLNTPLHGYGIIQNVKVLTNERLTIAPGTLYGAINTLIDKNYIELYDTNNDSNREKKEYIITSLGRKQLKHEISRLEELFNNGKKIIGGDKNEKI